MEDWFLFMIIKELSQYFWFGHFCGYKKILFVFICSQSDVWGCYKRQQLIYNIESLILLNPPPQLYKSRVHITELIIRKYTKTVSSHSLHQNGEEISQDGNGNVRVLINPKKNLPPFCLFLKSFYIVCQVQVQDISTNVAV